MVWSGCQSHCLTMKWKVKFVIFSTDWAAALLKMTQMLVTGPKIKNDFGNKNIMSKFRGSIRRLGLEDVFKTSSKRLQDMS